MGIKKHLNNYDVAICRDELTNFLDNYLNPAFGTLTKKEIDLLVFSMLENLSYINAKEGNPLYNDQLKLKITNTKVRNMFYEMELRRKTPEDLDKEVIKLLQKPLVLRDGKVFKIQIENPLVIDHFKAKVKSSGHLTDGSFSKEIVTLTDKAYFGLINEMVNESERQQLKQILIKAGATDTSLEGILKSITKHLLNKTVGKVGENLTDMVAERIEDGESKLIEIIHEIYKKDGFTSFMAKIKDIPIFFNKTCKQS